MRLDIISRDYATAAGELFSVCMTVLNEADGIEGFLGSLLAQTLPAHEIVIIDAGSTDGTIEKIGQFADPRINLLEVPGSSPAAARNMASRVASHELQITVDAGCILDRMFLANIVGPMCEADPPDITAGVFGPRIVSPWARYFIPDWRDHEYLRAKFLPSCRAAAMRRSLINRIGGFAENFTYKAGEDTFFMMKARKLSDRWLLNLNARVSWDAPTTFDEAMKLAYHYGVGNGQVGCAYYESHYRKSSDPVVGSAFEGYKRGCKLRMDQEACQLAHA